LAVFLCPQSPNLEKGTFSILFGTRIASEFGEGELPKRNLKIVYFSSALRARFCLNAFYEQKEA
jgi:hypothetical protein